ncbi:2,5-didehydrogluconate reductase [Neocallimastix lanati (nom. inval.)]|jgi:diketogulonate reductase-like aldo/keto reductase|uniref:2,5-didehydrogluconate reductase n=1 Tax=Neocallimastix californiae TaxID=1754190 RepID=A0A1Y2BI00_9FUNG|nr:2,5-didehydrogluconate reductase [Neocallimastix sp. JGI-2020a]ORY34396.1 2,5-didehydrogluconate reductase [Neocallimastix californiae]|eukprot:ORY34396.1 2,5-didehydrogluconate reductase [Neocallimastix californiae]
MTSPKIKLYNGSEIPQLGFGVYQIKGDELTEKCVAEALKVGYRHIDTAHFYENERGVGAAIKKSGIPRDQIWVTSKVWLTEYGSGKTTAAVEKMLKRLDMDYIDLVLLHQPYNDYIGAYKELEAEVEKGHIKNIGISNFEDAKFDEIYNQATIKPVLNQIELHPYNQQKEIREKMESLNCKTEGWAPLGEASKKLLNEEVIKAMAEKYKKSVAQVILRWHIQSGFITIPKSCNPERIKENFEIFDFELTDEEMKSIDDLNGKGRRLKLGNWLMGVGLWLLPAPKD